MRKAVSYAGRALACLLLGACVCSTARSDEQNVLPPQAESPTVTAARARLLDHLHRMRPDIQRFELTAIGHLRAHPTVGQDSTTARALAVSANAVHGDALSPRTCVWVAVGHGAKPAGSVPVWFGVKAFRSVLVSQRNRGARDVVDASDFTVEERDVAPLGGVPLEIDSNLTQMRARRVISSGHILLKGDVEPMPQILRGQEVTVEVKYRSVDIETSAVAMREGRLGESVTLQNPGSHMVYAARVVGQGRAVVIDR